MQEKHSAYHYFYRLNGKIGLSIAVLFMYNETALYKGNYHDSIKYNS